MITTMLLIFPRLGDWS